MNLDLLFEDIRTFFPTWHGSLKKNAIITIAKLYLIELPSPVATIFQILPMCVYPERSELFSQVLCVFTLKEVNCGE